MCRRNEALGCALAAAGVGLLLSLLLPGCICDAILGCLLLAAGCCVRRWK